MTARLLDNASVTARVAAAYARITEVDRPEVWITLRPRDELTAEAVELERRLTEGANLPLAGLLVAVKDNIDVAGLPTTAACPEFAYPAAESAAAVARLVEAGALILGKTNLDQFATGLVGTRSPYGAVRNALRPELIAGGSSSGSAAAVALGIADIALGTDTAGSGRVPAALHGIVGIKASLGVIPAHGVVPACADYDAVTVFAADLDLAVTAAATLTGAEPRDPRSRVWPADVALAASPRPKVAIPRPADLEPLSPAYRAAFADTVATLRDRGATITEIDISELLEAARLLYDGAIVAERYAAVGEFVSKGAAGLDPTVAGIISAAGQLDAHLFAADLDTLAVARAATTALLTDYDGLLIPTTTEHPSIAEVAADPVAINRRLGTYTNFCNLLDLAAVAVPGVPTADGLPFGVTFVVPGFADQRAVDLAALLAGEPEAPLLVRTGVPLAVFGAHLRGQPLHWQLEQLGARFTGEITTTDAYRLTALDTVPPKPGLVRHGDGLGAPIRGELFLVSPGGLGRFLAELPPPMALTSIELADGRSVIGFACSYDAAVAATDITEHGGWVAYLQKH
ncbi:allophanate hydrolase [Nocardia mangyaensis]|uniref:Allophanate hydrolase n=1 Tax=Nocardia mangyaensis TaxID=2213200 RepID=A0A1J0VLD1_9NOCA|nr:allophanate hydrolase [Nocardia mangyaensis]APE32852.1 allophanate hydrolase [Nocardia mangyaensis]